MRKNCLASDKTEVLFNIFINDIDMKIYRKITTKDDIRVLQQNLDKLYQWCLENKLKFPGRLQYKWPAIS